MDWPQVIQLITYNNNNIGDYKRLQDYCKELSIQTEEYT